MSYNYAPPATPTFTASFGNAGSSQLRSVLFGHADTQGSCMKLSATDLDPALPDLEAIWGFPEIGDPNVVPLIVGSLV